MNLDRCNNNVTKISSIAGPLIAIIVALSGCTGGDVAEPLPLATAVATIVLPTIELESDAPIEVTAVQGGEAVAPGELPGPDQPDKLALLALATTQNISQDGITVKEIRPVQWNDASLGCPQANALYAQVLTPGYLIILTANGVDYQVHLDLNGTALVCLDAESSLTDLPASDPIITEFIVQARFDLAQRLNAALEDIQLVSSETVEWTDSSLGCPQSGEEYVAVVTPGYLIVLSFEGQTYEYHAIYDRMLLCEEPE